MAVAWIPWCWPKDSVSAMSTAVTLAPWGGYISHVQCADDLLSSGSSAPGEPTLAPQIQPSWITPWPWTNRWDEARAERIANIRKEDHWSSVGMRLSRRN